MQVAQIERLDDADVLQHAELAVAMPILREELLRRAVGLERLERIFEPAVEDAQVGEQARLLARGQGLGRSLRLQVHLQRLVVAAQAQEEGAQVDEGEALAPRVPGRPGGRLDAFEGALIGVQGVEVLRLREQHGSDVVELLDLLLALARCAGKAERLLEVRERLRVIAPVEPDGSEQIQRAGPTVLIAQLAVDVGGFPAPGESEIVLAQGRRDLRQSAQRPSQIRLALAQLRKQRLVELLGLAQRALLLQRGRFGEALLHAVPLAASWRRLGEGE